MHHPFTICTEGTCYHDYIWWEIHHQSIYFLSLQQLALLKSTQKPQKCTALNLLNHKLMIHLKCEKHVMQLECVIAICIYESISTGNINDTRYLNPIKITGMSHFYLGIFWLNYRDTHLMWPILVPAELIPLPMWLQYRLP